jgi:hypothetical protein
LVPNAIPVELILISHLNRRLEQTLKAFDSVLNMEVILIPINNFFSDNGTANLFVIAFVSAG